MERGMERNLAPSAITIRERFGNFVECPKIFLAELFDGQKSEIRRLEGEARSIEADNIARIETPVVIFFLQKLGFNQHLSVARMLP
jgi:hypothetical protein